MVERRGKTEFRLTPSTAVATFASYQRISECFGFMLMSPPYSLNKK